MPQQPKLLTGGWLISGQQTSCACLCMGERGSAGPAASRRLTVHLHPQMHPHITAAGGDLREYQMSGLRWMEGLRRHGLNGILADEMGLGEY